MSKTKEGVLRSINSVNHGSTFHRIPRAVSSPNQQMGSGSNVLTSGSARGSSGGGGNGGGGAVVSFEFMKSAYFVVVIGLSIIVSAHDHSHFESGFYQLRTKVLTSSFQIS